MSPAATRRARATGAEAERTWRLVVDVVMETRGEWRRRVAEATGMPFSRTRALRRLEQGPLTLTELAEDMGIDAPAATVLINALETRGLVKRTPHPTDRRAKQVVITAAGRRILAVVDKLEDEPPPGFAQLSREELASLRRALQPRGDAGSGERDT
jgi:DNA-binding MarR family transcriptional regulator